MGQWDRCFSLLSDREYVMSFQTVPRASRESHARARAAARGPRKFLTKPACRMGARLAPISSSFLAISGDTHKVRWTRSALSWRCRVHRPRQPSTHLGRENGMLRSMLSIILCIPSFVRRYARSCLFATQQVLSARAAAAGMYHHRLLHRC